MAESASTIAPGRVILLNGTPSAGKSTIARALWEELEPPHWYRSIDDFRLGYRVRLHDPAPTWDQLVSGFVVSVAAMARSGHHLITESVLLPQRLESYAAVLNGLAVTPSRVRFPRARAP